MTRTTLGELDWPVRTKRLVIRLATAQDAAATFAIRTQADVARWLGSRPLDADAYAERFGQPDMLASTLVAEVEGVVICDLMISVEDAWAQAEVREQAAGAQADLGWVLDPAHAGRGLATEAVRAQLGICFDGLGLHRVIATCFAENEPSWRLMERVGMRREAATRKDSLHADGTWRDCYTYALLDEEWVARSS
jgi:RimJ/RimL family protein N-acetyltransferase